MSRILVPVAALLLAVAACGAPERPVTGSAARDSATADGARSEGAPTDSGTDPSGAPRRFTIRPDDYHVPYAGITGDGHRFFLSDELFDGGGPGTAPTGFVGLFLWNEDGTFAELRVDRVPRPEGFPAGQAVSAGADELVRERLAELGAYRLAPITVAPFTRTVDGVTFGWEVADLGDGTVSLDIAPGDFIAYYEPWDGLDYDT